MGILLTKKIIFIPKENKKKKTVKSQNPLNISLLFKFFMNTIRSYKMLCQYGYFPPWNTDALLYPFIYRLP